MDPSKQDYAAFFRFTQRPFSLTPDPKFYFRSRSHAACSTRCRRRSRGRESVMLVLGDLGVGKTTLCRTLLDLQERKSRAALVGNALLSPDDLLRLMLQDLGAVSKDEITAGPAGGRDARRSCSRCSISSSAGCSAIERRRGADRRRSAQPAAGDEGQVIEIASLESNRDRVLQFLLAGQPALGGAPMLPSRADDRLVGPRAAAAARARRMRALHHRIAWRLPAATP